MLVYLVRHAVAEQRGSWSEPDDLRPLSASGRRQAQALVRQRDWSAVASVRSSPAVRCVDTVRPLADALGLPVVVEPALAEAADPSKVLAVIESFTDGDLVLCTHGDVIPEVLKLIEYRGARLPRLLLWKKGSMWVLEHDGAAIVRAAYTPPPGKG
jgi:8-oxo-dGTP diphosphatase